MVSLAAPVHPDSRVTERQHYEQISRSTGRRHPKLEVTPLPSEIVYIWEWYNDVKTSTELTCNEILAWSQLSGIELDTFEFDMLRLLDLTYWKTHNDRNRKTSA